MLKTNTKLAFAISGAGKSGTALAMAIAGSEKGSVRRVVARTTQSAKNLAEQVGAPEWSSSFDDITYDQKVDAVVVASPDRFHCEQTVAALNAGKHVLCEKPMCRSIEEAEQMIDAAKRNNMKLMIGFTERFNQPCMEAKARIERGDIGRVAMILARRCHPKHIVRNREWLNDIETGGVLNYAGTHNIDLICWFMNAEPVRVYAETARLVLPEKQNFSDSAVMTLKFPDGRMAALYESFGYPSPYPHGVDRSIEILGEKGCIKIDFMQQPLTVFNESGYTLCDSVTWPSAPENYLHGGAVESEARHFIECVLDNKPVLTPGEAGLTALRWAEAAKRAARSGESVSG